MGMGRRARGAAGGLLAVAWAAACGADPPPVIAPAAIPSAPTASAVASARAPGLDAGAGDRKAATPPAPSSPACAASLPPVGMVTDNVRATAVTGIGEIVASSKTALDGKSPAPATGYVRFRYEVRVVRWLSGKGGDDLVVYQGAEAPGSPRAPGHLLLFSACRARDGSWHEPDVGYFFPVDASCRAELDALADVVEKRARSAAKPKSACDLPPP